MTRPIRAVLMLLIVAAPAAAAEDSSQTPPNRPKAPGALELSVRQRIAAPGADDVSVVERAVSWKASETAIIICDMWDDHYCKMAAHRVGLMVPRMNQVIGAARNHGVQIIHAPSGTMDFYADTPHRRRMQSAPPVQPPVPILKWCYLDPEVEAAMPIVDDAGVCCDDPQPIDPVRTYTRQHPGLNITGFDGISHSGEEIYNFCRQEGIKNIAIMGVHTNKCVLGRPFGIRQMVRLGMNVVLVRDLTDAMYDPRQPPYVSHARGVELVVEHIERYWCPTILSDDLMSVIPGSADPASPR